MARSKRRRVAAASGSGSPVSAGVRSRFTVDSLASSGTDVRTVVHLPRGRTRDARSSLCLTPGATAATPCAGCDCCELRGTTPTPTAGAPGRDGARRRRGGRRGAARGTGTGADLSSRRTDRVAGQPCRAAVAASLEGPRAALGAQSAGGRSGYRWSSDVWGDGGSTVGGDSQERLRGGSGGAETTGLRPPEGRRPVPGGGARDGVRGGCRGRVS